MIKDIPESIPFYNKNNELIASYNIYMNTLYFSWRITEEEKEDVRKQLERKRKVKYKEIESTGHKNK